MGRHWGLTKVQAARLDCCQRKMMRRVLGISLLDKISNEDLYKRCNIPPASAQAKYARWRLFGHTLRLSAETPARQSMAFYYSKDHSGRKGNRTTIATAISKEYKEATGSYIDSIAKYEELVGIAQDRDKWRKLVDNIIERQSVKRELKLEQKEEKRQEMKRRREEEVASEASSDVFKKRLCDKRFRCVNI